MNIRMHERISRRRIGSVRLPRPVRRGGRHNQAGLHRKLAERRKCLGTSQRGISKYRTGLFAIRQIHFHCTEGKTSSTTHLPPVVTENRYSRTPAASLGHRRFLVGRGARRSVLETRVEQESRSSAARSRANKGSLSNVSDSSSRIRLASSGSDAEIR